MDVVVVGGGAAGSLTALLFARRGHRVTVLEQDALPLHPDVSDAAAAGFRSSAPQLVQPHALNARARRLLRDNFPDVYDALLAAGAVEAMVDPQLAPGDDDLTMLMTRRSTFDLVMRRALENTPAVTLRTGVRVTGLDTRYGSPPRVTGVRTLTETISADLVVDASGRRTPIDRWLADGCARRSVVDFGECGLAYFSRHFRLREDASTPGPTAVRIVATLPDHLLGLWAGDNATMQLAVVPLAADRRYSDLREVSFFTAALRAHPTFAAWLEVLAPISEVFVMGGLHNTLRRLVVDAEPVIAGLHVAGDSLCTTNPTLSRGIAFALTNALDLVDVVERHPYDGVAQAVAYDACIAAHVAPYFTDQVAIDRSRLAQLRHVVFGMPAEASTPTADGVTYAELRAAAPHDAVAFRAFWQVQGMTCPPADVYTDPLVIARTRAVAC